MSVAAGKQAARLTKTAVTAAAAFGVLACTACMATSGTASPSSASTSASSPSPSAAAGTSSSAAATAQVGDCFDIGTDYAAIANRWVIDSPAVPCTPGTYTLQTIAVYDVPTDLPASIPEIDRAQAEADALPEGTSPSQETQDMLDKAGTALRASFDECWADFTDLVHRQTIGDITRTDMLFTFLSGPNEQEWADGARWLRCGVIMTLSPDSTRPSLTLLPLPAELANAANVLSTQLCSHGTGAGLVVLACDNPDLPEDAWLTLSLGTPVSSLDEYPGEAKARQVLQGACADFASHFIKPGTTLADADFDARVYLVDGTNVDDWSMKRTWNHPDMLFLCVVRLGLFADAT